MFDFMFIRRLRPACDGLGSGAFSCDMCGSPMLDLHCKLTCTRCGYKRDCSDP